MFTSDRNTGLVWAHSKHIIEPTVLAFMPRDSNLLAVMVSMYGLKEYVSEKER